MTNITGGSVTYGETRKLADYQSLYPVLLPHRDTTSSADTEGRNVAVTLSFGAPDGGSMTEADISAVLDIAEALVRQRQVPSAAKAAAIASPTTTTAPPASTAKPTVAAKTDSGGTGMDVVATQPQHSAHAAAAAPTAKTAAPPATAKPADPLASSAELFTGSSKELTDVDLQKAITAKNEASQGKRMAEIRAKIGAYSTAANKSFTGIPQVKREAFLLELASIPS